MTDSAPSRRSTARRLGAVAAAGALVATAVVVFTAGPAPRPRVFRDRVTEASQPAPAPAYRPGN